MRLLPLLLLALAACRGPNAEELSLPFPEGFATVALDGHAVTPETLKGKAVLLSFWSPD